MRRITRLFVLLLASASLLAGTPKPVPIKLAFDPYVYPSGTNVLKNGNFEAGSANWAVSGNCDIADVPLGKAMRFNAGNTTPNAVISQGFATTAGLTYSVSFSYGIMAWNNVPQSILVTLTGNGAAVFTQQWAQTGTMPGTTNIAFVVKTFTFVANADTTVITFKDVSTTTDSIDSYIDNVFVDPSLTTGIITVYKSTWLGTLASPWKKTAIMPWGRNTIGLAVLPGTYYFRVTASAPPAGTNTWIESDPSNTVTNTVK